MLEKPETIHLIPFLEPFLKIHLEKCAKIVLFPLHYYRMHCPLTCIMSLTIYLWISTTKRKCENLARKVEEPFQNIGLRCLAYHSGP
jgi:hypothetical protein